MTLLLRSWLDMCVCAFFLPVSLSLNTYNHVILHWPWAHWVGRDRGYFFDVICSTWKKEGTPYFSITTKIVLLCSYLPISKFVFLAQHNINLWLTSGLPSDILHFQYVQLKGDVCKSSLLTTFCLCRETERGDFVFYADRLVSELTHCVNVRLSLVFIFQ